MAVQNTMSVKIGGIIYTRKAVFPIKFANLLDERLDECYLSLRQMKRKEFKSLTPVEIIFHNRVYYGYGENENTIYKHDEPVQYFAANDNANESPVGSGLWNHDLYLIELTKYLEMIVVDSLTYTNNLGRNYNINSIANYVVSGTETEHMYVEANREHFKEMAIYGKPYDFAAPYDMGQIYDNNRDGFRNYTCYVSYDLVVRSRGINVFECHVYTNSLTGGQGRTQIKGTVGGYSAQTPISFVYPPEIGNEEIAVWEDLKSRFVPEMGQTYEVTYTYKVDPAEGLKNEGVPRVNAVLSYGFAVVANQYPLKRLTCTDVLKRLLDLAEPLRMGDVPTFTLNAEQALKFDGVYAPQFSFTRQTLRECLQEVGKVLHGEPRLRVKNGKYEIYYDMYGGTKRSFVGRFSNVFRSSQTQIERYCTGIDSTAQNLINQTDWAAGVITEPSLDDYRTVRTETQYVRISDSNMIIATDRPIYQIQSLKVLVPNGRYVTGLDITPYVVESTIYDSQLSSYKSEFPYSKAFGIYFTQGQRNIKGLNFKPDRAIAPAFANYAIVNIIQRAANAAGINWAAPAGEEFPNLAFQVEYLPYFDIRVSQTKSYYKEYDKAVALVYNQSSNTIESRYYGENLKGVVARLGNIEKTITYNLARWWQIPKAGELYDDDYYISAVTVEFLPSYIKCMVGLSKDFNRLNEYIGVSSEKRYYEVSERQTYDRSVLYRNYIIVGDSEELWRTMIGQEFMDAVADTFTQEGNYKPITYVTAWGGTYSDPVAVTVGGEVRSPLPCVQLPVVSTAIGNSMAFMWNYQDNYSAGSVSQYETNGEVSGYWQNDYQYTDYYGKMYYYNFDLFAPGTLNPNEDYELLVKKGRQLPQENYPADRSQLLSTGLTPYIFRKDSREVPQFNVQVEFVTNRKGLIIGSALASSCSLIRGSDSTLKASLYILNTRVNKFATVYSTLSDDPDMRISTPIDIHVTKEVGKFCLTSDAFPHGGKSWIIATNETAERQTVEDEFGNISEQVIYKGGEVLLASNDEVKEGESIGEIWFTPRESLFDRAMPIYGEIYRATADTLEAMSGTTIAQENGEIQVVGEGLHNSVWGCNVTLPEGFDPRSSYIIKFDGLRQLSGVSEDPKPEFSIGLGNDEGKSASLLVETWDKVSGEYSQIFNVENGWTTLNLGSAYAPFAFKSFTISKIYRSNNPWPKY